jgi:hypothetical protein
LLAVHRRLLGCCASQCALSPRRISDAVRCPLLLIAPPAGLGAFLGSLYCAPTSAALVCR